MMFSPYNNTRPYHPWDGEDCSYLFAYAGDVRTRSQSTLTAAVIMFIVILLLSEYGNTCLIS